MTIQILPEAEQDLIDGYHFYELQRAGLGRYFFDTLSSDIDSLEFFCGIHPVFFGQYRLLSRRFRTLTPAPGRIFDRITGSTRMSSRPWKIL